MFLMIWQGNVPSKLMATFTPPGLMFMVPLVTFPVGTINGTVNCVLFLLLLPKSPVMFALIVISLGLPPGACPPLPAAPEFPPPLDQLLKFTTKPEVPFWLEPTVFTANSKSNMNVNFSTLLSCFTAGICAISVFMMALIIFSTFTFANLSNATFGAFPLEEPKMDMFARILMITSSNAVTVIFEAVLLLLLGAEVLLGYGVGELDGGEEGEEVDVDGLLELDGDDALVGGDGLLDEVLGDVEGGGVGLLLLLLLVLLLLGCMSSRPSSCSQLMFPLPVTSKFALLDWAFTIHTETNASRRRMKGNRNGRWLW